MLFSVCFSVVYNLKIEQAEQQNSFRKKKPAQYIFVALYHKAFSIIKFQKIFSCTTINNNTYRFNVKIFYQNLNKSKFRYLPRHLNSRKTCIEKTKIKL